MHFKLLGWKNFVTPDADFIYSWLIHKFFANAIIDEDIPTVTSFVKGNMIILSELHLNDWLDLNLSRPKVFSGNKQAIVMPSLTNEVQLVTIFRDDYVDYEFLPSHNYLSKKLHILHKCSLRWSFVRQSKEMRWCI